MSKQAKTPPELALRGAALRDRVNGAQERRKLVIGYYAMQAFIAFWGRIGARTSLNMALIS
ncbi:MAG TPA: hypothetical protein VN826_09410 [Candidatus Eisenbacteria bacterium]|nr:hypothetical protein [Candidatus Eisenbacteria bacterium]